ncbi:TIR domain-containing adapter molecule 1 [Brachyhypopomus gauderio]|uniref:TIR domain-containing adapter molecule 1 n=1 Tax=Brachyhypopomus gauderio TaxID=698409 RepID=UPI0040416FA8
MAEEKRLPGDKLTGGAQLCANHNSPIKNPCGDVPERLLGSEGTENNFGAARAVGGHQIMACSNLPSRESADTLKDEGQGDGHESYPSSLRSCSTGTSYSLEISLSASDSNNKESGPLPLRTAPGSRDDHSTQTNTQVPLLGGGSALVTHPCTPAAPKPLEKRHQTADSNSAYINQCVNMLDSCQIVTSKSTIQEQSLEESFSSLPGGSGKVGAQPVPPGQSHQASFTRDAELGDGFSEEKTFTEEEDQFYAFVILHAPEDTEEAVRIQLRLETVSSTTGATFSEDFAEPGRSIFRCVEDAIHNSAYVMLLLTPNFNTRQNETNTDSALMNSIEKSHKFNTVIPLLPKTNALAKDKFPLVLRTKNSLDERNKNFEGMAKRALAAKKIEAQKTKWRQELHVKKQQENQQRLHDENRHHRDFIRERKKVEDLKLERIRLLKERVADPYPQMPSDQDYFHGGQSHGHRPYQWPYPMSPHPSEPPSNINIQHAQYIIIGNDSTMTVGGAGNSSGDEVT